MSAPTGFWRLPVRIAAGLLVLATIALLAGWWTLHASMAQLGGDRRLAGLNAEVIVERDANGIPTIRARTNEDLARTLGYLHAQDRFFEMDLLRRQGAGELAELFGTTALPMDRKARRNRFRRLASATLARSSAADLRQLDAYVAGVNAGLDALAVRPWEYLALRSRPRPWTREDSLLVMDAMTINLQGGAAAAQRTHLAVMDAYGPAVLAFLSPRELARTSALDGSSAPAPPVPDAADFRPRQAAVAAASGASMSTDSPEGNDLARQLAGWFHGPADAMDGSNNFALAGSRVAGGGALVANDMHLGLAVPTVWYRVAMRSPARSFTGVSLPGVPTPIVGSNGAIAWGFTDAYIGSSDVVIVETDPADPTRYRVPDGSGWEKLAFDSETIAVSGHSPEILRIASTRWGPLLTEPGAPGRMLALHWVAYDPGSANLLLSDMADAHSVDEAVSISREVGIPTENMIVGDSAGNIAWTLIGEVPRRVGFDGFLPVSWADGSKRWDGYLAPEETPTVRNPPDGQLWSANNRVVGGDALARVGDGGYDDPALAAQIRDRLSALAGRLATPRDLLAIQLDDESRFLAPWRDLLLRVVSEEAVRQHPELAELRRLVSIWNGDAAIDECGHRLVRDFRTRVAKEVLDPIYAPVRALYPQAEPGTRSEQPLWSILEARPAYLLPDSEKSWDALLLDAATLTARTAQLEAGGSEPLRDCTWGELNMLAMRHPLSAAFPGWLSARLDMRAQPMPGDIHMPRVQGPTFGASERMVVSPGREGEGIFHQPGGASGHPLSAFYRAGHDDWVYGRATPFLPGEAKYRLTLRP